MNLLYIFLLILSFTQKFGNSKIIKASDAVNEIFADGGLKGEISDDISKNSKQFRTHGQHGGGQYNNKYNNQQKNKYSHQNQIYHQQQQKLKAQYLADKHRLKHQYKPGHKPGVGGGQYYKPPSGFKPKPPFKPIRNYEDNRAGNRGPEIVLIPSLSQLFGGASRAATPEYEFEFEPDRSEEEEGEGIFIPDSEGSNFPVINQGTSGGSGGSNFPSNLASGGGSGSNFGGNLGSGGSGGIRGPTSGGGAGGGGGSNPLQAVQSLFSGLGSSLQNFLPSFSGANSNTNSAGNSPSFPSIGSSSGSSPDFPILSPGSGGSSGGGSGGGGGSNGVASQPGPDSQTQFPIITGPNSVINGGGTRDPASGGGQGVLPINPGNIPVIGGSNANGVVAGSGNDATRFEITTAIPRQVVEQIHRIVESVSGANIQNTVDSSVSLLTPDESVRNLVSGVVQRLFCSPVGRLTGQCQIPDGLAGILGGGKDNEEEDPDDTGDD